MTTTCEECGLDVESDEVMLCMAGCGADGLCPDCANDHGCDGPEGTS